MALLTMEAQQAIELVNQLLAPRRLSYLEELLLIQTWSGKLYREIALEAGYELSYIRDVGARLWSALSAATGKDVSKKNVQLILGQLADQRMSNSSEESPGGWKSGASPADSPFPEARPSTGQVYVSWGDSPWILDSFPTREADPLADRTEGSEAVPSSSQPLMPGSPLNPGASLYVDRPPIETAASTMVQLPGSLLRVRAPQKMGKTSLLYRLLFEARQQGMYTVLLSLRQVDRSLFGNLDRFLRWICWNISRQLNLSVRLDDYWFTEIGSKISCTTYLQDHILQQIDRPVLLVWDDVSLLFEQAELTQDVLPLLRTWHENAMINPVWRRLRLALAYSTETIVPLPVHQSPFNVGHLLQLPELTLEQIDLLSQRYRLPEAGISLAELTPLVDLVGGHPYLLQLAFYWLRFQRRSVTDIIEGADTLSGIYGEYLRQLWFTLQRYSMLKPALRAVVTATEGISMDAITAYHLESAGIIKLHGDKAVPSCDLYRRYFQRHLEELE